MTCRKIIPRAAGLALLAALALGACGCRVREQQSPRVTLRWNASVSAGRPARDPVVGYNIYRGTRPHEFDPRPLNSAPVTAATYVDVTVERGKTYFYVTRTVTARGVTSRSSNEVEAVVPAR